jgi:hypothetical protein
MRILVAFLVVAVLLVPACTRPDSAPTIAQGEVDAALTKAVILAAAKLGATDDVCFAEGLAPSIVQPANDPIVDGWHRGPSPQVFYRNVDVPPRHKLPKAALAGLSSGIRRPHCQHMIVFEEPSVVQLRVRQETYMQIYVPFSDRCPLCGAGYQVAFRQTSRDWQIEPPGITATWIS